ncbi:hypothetical protein ACFV4F_38955 [Kitasatospora sp. NPDC059722]|uniref:hypothetical protein n=1 Tax=unclassified Kitasatospora TaxID=2633591 RepID=UPI003659584C
MPSSTATGQCSTLIPQGIGEARRFKAVVYLSKTGTAFPELEMQSCEEYAQEFGWGIALTVVDEEVEKSPDRRRMLQAALQKITDGEADAILVPSKAAISPIEGEYNEFAARVEKAAGFVQVAARR